eukprot:scaffold81102_cov32-Tisochrysis_lutea.AAC.5
MLPHAHNMCTVHQRLSVFKTKARFGCHPSSSGRASLRRLLPSDDAGLDESACQCPLRRDLATLLIEPRDSSGDDRQSGTLVIRKVDTGHAS